MRVELSLLCDDVVSDTVLIGFSDEDIESIFVSATVVVVADPAITGVVVH